MMSSPAEPYSNRAGRQLDRQRGIAGGEGNSGESSPLTTTTDLNSPPSSLSQ